MAYVYALVDPVNKIPFYIGKGNGDRMRALNLGKKLSESHKQKISEAHQRRLAARAKSS